MKILDRFGLAFNIILGIIYVPMSAAGLLGGLSMAIAFMGNVANQFSLVIMWITVVIWILLPALCISAIVWSVYLRIIQRSVLSFIIQFIPLALFIITYCLSFLIETTPPAV